MTDTILKNSQETREEGDLAQPKHASPQSTPAALEKNTDVENFSHAAPSDPVPFIETSSVRHSRPSFTAANLTQKFSEVNKELWLILSLLIIAFAMNYLVTAHRMVLGFYTLPTLFSAYFFGRRHATLTAVASVFLVGLLAHYNPRMFSEEVNTQCMSGRYYDLFAWGCMLIITAYAMGTLHERHAAKMRELQATYYGLLMILRQFIAKDKYTENHSYRVSIYAATIASHLGLNMERIEEVRAAALLHDIGKLDISRDLLYKAAQLSQNEYAMMKKHVDKGASILEPVGSSLRRIIPIILAHHDRFDGTGEKKRVTQEIPIESRVISVADVFDAMTSDRPYRKAMSPYDAKEIIVKGAGKEFDPKVVSAFVVAFQKRELEIPEIFV